MDASITVQGSELASFPGLSRFCITGLGTYFPTGAGGGNSVRGRDKAPPPPATDL